MLAVARARTERESVGTGPQRREYGTYDDLWVRSTRGLVSEATAFGFDSARVLAVSYIYVLLGTRCLSYHLSLAGAACIARTGYWTGEGTSLHARSPTVTLSDLRTVRANCAV